jgi:hypothetical protein
MLHKLKNHEMIIIQSTINLPLLSPFDGRRCQCWQIPVGTRTEHCSISISISGAAAVATTAAATSTILGF